MLKERIETVLLEQQKKLFEMAGNYLTLHTNDRVVVTTSRGNQEKWFDAEKNLWYKVDDGCFEALAEAVSSEVLRNFTNAARLPGISVANYSIRLRFMA